MSLEIQRYFLEINSVKDLLETAKPSNIYEVSLINPPDFQLNKFFYKQIGKNYRWIDRLVWSEKKWINYVNNSDKNEFMVTINKSERKKDKAIEDEAFFTHIRYLKKLPNNKFDVEGYVQRSENPFQSYSIRDIAGIGLRFKLFQNSKFGISVLDEKEERKLILKK